MLTLNGSLRGEFLLEFHRAEVALLVSQLPSQPANESGAEQTEHLLKLIETAVSEFRHALEQEYGTFTINASSASLPPSEGASVVQVALVNDDSVVSVAMYITPELAAVLTFHSQSGTAAAETEATTKAASGVATQEPVNLDLVMDVELNVTLRFGKRRLTLREVMELTTGSVVELDRELEEPVELLLNGMVIARGEAVVIDGNYGLRVTEVSQHVSTMELN
jgi:flagellar motor switch protein FliN/FliY